MMRRAEASKERERGREGGVRAARGTLWDSPFPGWFRARAYLALSVGPRQQVSRVGGHHSRLARLRLERHVLQAVHPVARRRTVPQGLEASSKINVEALTLYVLMFYALGYPVFCESWSSDCNERNAAVTGGLTLPARS